MACGVLLTSWLPLLGEETHEVQVGSAYFLSSVFWFLVVLGGAMFKAGIEFERDRSAGTADPSDPA